MSDRRTTELRSDDSGRFETSSDAQATPVVELLARAERAERSAEEWLRNCTASDLVSDSALAAHRAGLSALYRSIGAAVVRAARAGRSLAIVDAIDGDARGLRQYASLQPSELAETLPPGTNAASFFETLRPDDHPSAFARKTEDFLLPSVSSSAAQTNSDASRGASAPPSSERLDVSETTIERLRGQRAAAPPSLSEKRKERRRAELGDVRFWYDRLGPTPRQLDRSSALRELEHVESLIDDAVDRWGQLDKTRNFQLTAWLTKRLRAVQSVLHETSSDADAAIERLDAVFRAVSVHSKMTRPGFVYGLALDHEPEHDTWLLDALNREAGIRAELGLPVDDSGDAPPEPNSSVTDDE